MEYLPLIFIVISIIIQILKRVNKKNDGMTEEERFEAMKRRVEEAQRRQKEKELEKERGYSLPPVLETPEMQPTPKAEPSYQGTAKPSCQPSTEPNYQSSEEPNYQPKAKPSYQSEASYQSSDNPSYDPNSKTSYKPGVGTGYQPSTSSTKESGKPSWPSYEKDRQDNHGGQAMASKLKQQLNVMAQAETAVAQNDLIVARSTKPLYSKRRFSPLQQGILWATILDRPLSQQRSGGYRGIRSRV